MEILFQILIIFGFAFIGDSITSLFQLPIPGSIIGLVGLFLALQFKIVKLERIETVGNWLKNNLAFLFVPPTVGIMAYFDVLKTSWLDILIVLMVSTLVTYFVTGKIAQVLNRKDS